MSSRPERTAELVIRPDSALSAQDIAELWEYRELLWTFAARDISIRYKQAALGVLWAVIQPAVQVLVFTLVFNRFAKIPSGSDVAYPVFCMSGVLVWTMFTTALTNSSDSLVSNAHLLTKVYFPRAVIPAAAVIPAMADFLFGFLLMAPVLLIFGVPLRPTLLLAPFIALLAPLAALAVGLWVSAVNARYRDVRYAVPFFIQLFVFVTPVFYPPELVPARYAPFLALNPMAAVVESFRAAVLGTPIPAGRLAIAALIIAILIVTGFAWFRRLERGIADVV